MLLCTYVKIIISDNSIKCMEDIASLVLIDQARLKLTNGFTIASNFIISLTTNNYLSKW